jgi:hypothetical protein
MWAVPGLCVGLRVRVEGSWTSIKADDVAMLLLFFPSFSFQLNTSLILLNHVCPFQLLFFRWCLQLPNRSTSRPWIQGKFSSFIDDVVDY